MFEKYGIAMSRCLIVSKIREQCFLIFQLRLVSINTGFAALVLRFLRSNHDLIYRLAKSPLFLDTEERNGGEENMVLKNLKIAIQGLVLHLCAIEISTLLQNKHYRFVVRLLVLVQRLRNAVC